jgi:hypothetical protein
MSARTFLDRQVTDDILFALTNLSDDGPFSLSWDETLVIVGNILPCPLSVCASPVKKLLLKASHFRNL